MEIIDLSTFRSYVETKQQIVEFSPVDEAELREELVEPIRAELEQITGYVALRIIAGTAAGMEDVDDLEALCIPETHSRIHALYTEDLRFNDVVVTCTGKQKRQLIPALIMKPVPLFGKDETSPTETLVADVPAIAIPALDENLEILGYK